MKACLLFVLIIFTSNSFSQNVSPQFSELNGMEDQSGNTHLFYRIYSYIETPWGHRIDNSIYRFDLITGFDSLFLDDFVNYSYVSHSSVSVGDFDHWNKNPEQFIYGGEVYIASALRPYVQRFENSISIWSLSQFSGEIQTIHISDNNDSLLYAGLEFNNHPGMSIRSTDGGWNWEELSDIFSFQSLFPNEDQIFFSHKFFTINLYKTIDGGLNYYMVDSVAAYPEVYFQYDPDNIHIYRVSSDPSANQFVFRVSNNKGEEFSWETKYSSASEIFISHDISQSGTIYLAKKNGIYLSTDYGESFNIYKSFERYLIGIYKKPNSDKLYAATKYKIYEITPDSTQVIKIPDEVLNYYPLTIGNKWVFDKTTVSYDPYPQYSHEILVKEVLGDTIAANGKQYYYLRDETVWEEDVLERVDSSEGKVYRYLEDPGLPENEYIIDDLLAEVGDTVISYRMGYYPGSYTTVLDQITFYKWWVLLKHKKILEQYILHPPVYSLTQDIGLDSIYSYFDFGENWIVLKGCIIDGIVYGDTTVVSVEDETPNLPTEFSLSQNYPNPFNPSTSIQYAVSSRQFVSLKVYNVLGKEIATLVNEELPAGEYEVEFTSHSGSVRNLPSGIYFYQLKAGSFIQTKKMVLMK